MQGDAPETDGVRGKCRTDDGNHDGGRRRRAGSIGQAMAAMPEGSGAAGGPQRGETVQAGSKERSASAAREVNMAGSCCNGGCAVEALRMRQKGTLLKVLWINAVMFVLIAGAAVYGRSTALLSDSLDNLGDTLTYGLSLYVVSQDLRAKARVALFKGGLILCAALVVIGQILWKLAYPATPSHEVMSLFSLAGLAANAVCLWLLWRHRHEDINMSSVFECSRNDIASNLSVLLAAGGVWLLDAGWPDLVVAGLLALLLLRSSLHVIRGALAGLDPRQTASGAVS